MSEDVPITKDHAVIVAIPGTDRTYTMRAPTFGQMGKTSLAMVAAMLPSEAVVMDALREAVDASDLPDDVKEQYRTFLEEYASAQEAFDDALTEHGPRSEWGDEARAEMRKVIRDRRWARANRDRVEWAMRNSEPVVRIMQHRVEVEHKEQAALIAACLGVSVEAVDALPSSDAAILGGRALALTRPSADAEKN